MILFKTLNDDQLLMLLKQGDDGAFTELYNRYWKMMGDYAFRLTKSEEEGADIAQEIFISLWRRRAILETKSSLPAYLKKAARNLSIKYRQKQLENDNKIKYLTRKSNNYFTEDVTEDMHVKQLQHHLNKIISKLPHKMRTVYLLSRNGQLSHAEISSKLKIKKNTVKKQINNALKIISTVLIKLKSFTLFLECSTLLVIQYVTFFFISLDKSTT